MSDTFLLIDPADADGWRLTTHGAAIHRREKTAVVADVHLGYDWARARGGDMVPPHALRETIQGLDRLLDGDTIERLIVAGDLVESPRFCPRTARDLRTLREWLDGRGVRLELVAGNHDPWALSGGVESLDIGGWTIAHGHRAVTSAMRGLIIGHWHPVARLAGVTARCFLVSPTRVVLPAFTENAAGIDVVATCPNPLVEAGTRCVVIAGDGVLDFGLLSGLGRGVEVERMRRAGIR